MRGLAGLLALAGMLAAAGGLFSGCTRDPNVRKQKYLESGNSYLATGKYREASIEYQTALQIDAEFLPAHVQLAEAWLKMGAFPQAARELSRVVHLYPQIVKPLLEGGLLAGEAR